MKLTTSILTLLFIALFFSGCASADSANPIDSADSKSPDSESTLEEQPETTTDDRRSGSLMDRYLSGEIPGYRD